MIYLASPYTHKDKNIMTERYILVCRQTAKMINKGMFVISPIAHSRAMEAFGIRSDWGFWENYDKSMLLMCGQLYVLMIDGWKDSVGVQAEIEFADEHKLKITYIEMDD